MDWHHLLSAKRLFENRAALHERDAEDVRGPYLKDADRITYSPAFRRLKNRTQVYPLATSEYVRTRLTHSMEVASIGRSLGLRVAREILQKEKSRAFFGFESSTHLAHSIGNILAAASLAHDLGSPPFGHTGERAIRYFFEVDYPHILDLVPDTSSADFLLYDANAQTFRIVSRLEFWRDAGGMRLTCATISTLVKSPWNSATAEHQNAAQQSKFPKFGYFQSEERLFDIVAKEVGLTELAPRRFARHPLSYLLDAADDMTYLTADLEDGANMGLVEFERAETLLAALVQGDDEGYRHLSSDDSVKLAFLRARALGVLLSATINAFSEAYDEIMEGRLSAPLLDRTPFAAALREIRKCCQQHIFGFESKQVPEFSGWNAVRSLLRLYCDVSLELESRGFDANKYPPLWSFDTPQFFRSIEPGTTRYEWLLRVLDFLVSLSDRRALEHANERLTR